MDHADSLAAQRIRRFLRSEPVIWLSTVRPNGAPHVVPIWFWWDGEAVLVFSKPDAQKVRNLRLRPSVMLALGDAEDDFDIGMIEGRAELLDTPTAEVMPEAHVEKYREKLDAIGLDAPTYAETYSQVIRIVPIRYLGWHGRNVPQSARLAGAPVRSLVEPRRLSPSAMVGEPIAAIGASLPAVADPPPVLTDGRAQRFLRALVVMARSMRLEPRSSLA
jgi:PPOX class probable F420-dependent enzyme